MVGETSVRRGRRTVFHLSLRALVGGSVTGRD